MDDIKFVVKTFLASLILVLMLQIKVGPLTLEERMHEWVETSSISLYLTKSAQGGALAIQNGWEFSKRFITNVLSGEGSSDQENQASK